MAFSPNLTTAEVLRIATFAAPLSRDGPGLLLRDIQKGQDQQIIAIQAVITHLSPDVLLLTDFDYDLNGHALAAFATTFDDQYLHQFAARPNTGLATGLDMDQNGRRGEPRDAQGYGRFAGDGGMAILSRFPIGEVSDLSDILWRDLPGATLPDGFYPPEILDVQRLSTSGH